MAGSELDERAGRFRDASHCGQGGEVAVVMQERSTCTGGHGRDEAIDQTARSHASCSAALLQVGGRLEVVARADEFNVETLQQPTQLASLSVRSRPDE